MKKITFLLTLLLTLTSTNLTWAMAAQQSTGSTTSSCVLFTNDLSIGDTDKEGLLGDVYKLQTFLYPKYLSEKPTGYFGQLTKIAVSNFQADNGIIPAIGYVGEKTRNIIKWQTCGNTAVNDLQSAPVGTLSAYNMNDAWWLPPAPTPQSNPSPSTVTTPTTNIGNTAIKTTAQTPISTTTPPSNCEQYSGVIPGDSRRVSYTTIEPRHKKYNYPMSAEGQAQHQSMYGYFGYIEHFFGSPAAAFGNRPRIVLDSGRALVVPFKTASEYNYMPSVSTFTFETPQTAEGVVYVSISECPADFTSPFFAGTPNWQGNVTIPGNGPGKYCLSAAPAGRNSIDITVGNPGGFTCDLQPNKTYYYNITAGFANPTPAQQSSMNPHIGELCSPAGCSMQSNTYLDTYTTDRSISARSSATERSNLELIKGKSEYYSENRRIAGVVASGLQARVAACSSEISRWLRDPQNTTGTHNGRLCSGLASPLPAYEWE